MSSVKRATKWRWNFFGTNNRKKN